LKKGDALRSCLGCREIAEKKKLLRLVLSPDNEVVLDFYSKLPGRGAYVCPQLSCMEKALKGNALKRAFRGSVKMPVLDEVARVFTLQCTEKIASLLSMAIRSRKISLGTEAVEGELKKGNLSLLLLSRDLSETAGKKWETRIAAKAINIKRFPDTEGIKKVLGGRKVAALKDSGLAAAIIGEIGKLEKIGTDLI